MNITTTKLSIGHNLYVFIGAKGDNAERDAWIAKMRASIKANGPMVKLPDGTEEWIEDREIEDITKTGSDRLQWHSDGNRVRGNRERVTKSPDGKITREIIKKIWMKYE